MSPEDYIAITVWYSKMKFMNTIIDMSFYAVPTLLGGATFGVFGYGIYQTAQGLVNTAVDTVKTLTSVGIKGAFTMGGFLGSIGVGAYLGSKRGIGAVKGGLKGAGYYVARQLQIPATVFQIGKDGKSSPPPSPPPSTPPQTPPPSTPPQGMVQQATPETQPKESVIITPDTSPREWREGLMIINKGERPTQKIRGDKRVVYVVE